MARKKRQSLGEAFEEAEYKSSFFESQALWLAQNLDERDRVFDAIRSVLKSSDVNANRRALQNLINGYGSKQASWIEIVLKNRRDCEDLGWRGLEAPEAPQVENERD